MGSKSKGKNCTKKEKERTRAWMSEGMKDDLLKEDFWMA